MGMLSKLKPGMKSSINTRRKAMRIIGLIIVLVFVLVLTGGHTAGVFHPLGIVIVFSLGALLFGGTSFPTMFKAVFSSKATDEELSAGSDIHDGCRLDRAVVGDTADGGGDVYTRPPDR
jgi:flagellar basal body-associated protein FliL